MTDNNEILMDIRERVVRIETKMEATENLEKRVAGLEESINKQKGVHSALMALWGALGTIIGIAVGVFFK